MRIGMQTWGSEGDLRPFFAIGRGLAARGHEVTLAYSSVEGRDYADLAAACGIEAFAVGADHFRALREGGDGAPERVLSASTMRQLRWLVAQYYEPVLEPMWAAARTLAARSDVLVGHALCHPLATATEEARRPGIAIAPTPMFPTRAAPPPGAPDLGPANRLTWLLVERAVNAVFLARTNSLRDRAGLPRLRNLFRDGFRGVAGLLTAISPSLFPQPPDWPEKAPVVGFLELPVAAEPWAPDPALEAFLAAGPPPVLLTFGSMMAEPRLAAGGVELLRAAAAGAGVRALLQGPAGLAAGPAGRDLFVLGRIPHAAILPRCAAVVHHGGAGTTQAAARAGLPSVVVPHLLDQHFWAEALRARGVAPRPLPRRCATPAALATRIRAAVGDAPMRARAAALGAAMRAEDGVARAVALVEDAAGRAR
jgi:UDP:flavonoid glycosyltransferase YjiC (YdhE family)